MKQREFPRNFRSSSAAYRAIYQYENRNGIKKLESGLVVTKISDNDFRVASPEKNKVGMLEEEILKNLNSEKIISSIEFEGTPYRFFPDGLHSCGYYEIKTGNRRRPNSKFIDLKKAIELYYV